MDVEAIIDTDATAFTQLSQTEQAEFLRRCSADPAFTELNEESKRRWSRSEKRSLFVLLVVGFGSALLFVSHDWVFYVLGLGGPIAWFLAEYRLWYRWYAKRQSEVARMIILRELEQLPKDARTSSTPTSDREMA